LLDPVLVEGQGSIDLGDETLNMSVTGKPKEFRIGRVRAPILITGRLAHPHIGIDPGPAAAQGGLAIVLGILFPPAAICRLSIRAWRRPPTAPRS
jgi:hypothetical protein